MLYTIENEKVRVAISDVGAEMMSFQLKEDNCEYLWQGNPEFWHGRACNLFPICGRLTEGKYTYRGQTYEMNLHGFARKSTMTMIGQKDDAIRFCLTDTEESFKMYPFHFELIIGYQLEGTTVHQTFQVRNTDEKNLIFAVGGHPGFNVPLTEGEKFEDYYVEFDCAKEPKKVVMSETCYDTGKREAFPLEDGKRLSLTHDLFDHDAIFLTDMCKGITLKSRCSCKSVHLSYPDMNAVGLWHAPRKEAPYVCIEPWYSLPAYDGEIDDLETKQLMLSLAPGKVYTNTFTITIA